MCCVLQASAPTMARPSPSRRTSRATLAIPRTTLENMRIESKEEVMRYTGGFGQGR